MNSKIYILFFYKVFVEIWLNELLLNKRFAYVKTRNQLNKVCLTIVCVKIVWAHAICDFETTRNNMLEKIEDIIL